MVQFCVCIFGTYGEYHKVPTTIPPNREPFLSTPLDSPSNYTARALALPPYSCEHCMDVWFESRPEVTCQRDPETGRTCAYNISTREQHKHV